MASIRYAVRVGTQDRTSVWEIYAGDVEKAMMKGQSLHYDKHGYNGGDEIRVRGIRMLLSEKIEDMFLDDDES